MKLLIAVLWVSAVVIGCVEATRKFVPITDEQWADLELKTPTDEEGNFLPFCPTDQLSNWKQKLYGREKHDMGAACKGEGQCDDPQFRNQYSPFPMEINIVVNVVCSAPGVCPSNVDQAAVDGQVKQLNEDFFDINLTFNLTQTNFVVNPALSTISAYGLSNEWYNQIREVKADYAVDPKNNINVFITGQTQGFFGTLLGIGTFPWDAEALTEYGGLWLNAAYTGYGFKTLGHEFGHNIGLWHVFHGVSEVPECSACYENPHPDGDEAANLVGDFASDTGATPTNYNCRQPTSSSPCDGKKWTAFDPTPIHNIMAYTDDACMEHLTPEQAGRAHCWVCNAIPSVMTDASRGDC